MIDQKTKSRLAKKIYVCDSLFSKATGLMFRKKLEDSAMLFLFKEDRIVGLHMLFVFQSIDVLWLDKNKKIVELKENFKPFTTYIPKNVARYVVELPYGKIKETKTKIGDIIDW